MNTKTKKQLLDALISEAEEVREAKLGSPKLKSWHEKVLRRLAKVYGEDSRELQSFQKIGFFETFYGDYDQYVGILSEEEIMQVAYEKHINKHMDEAIPLLTGFKEDLEFESNYSASPKENISKIFISHSSKDKELVSEILQLLTLIGVRDESIFCTSLDGYGIPVGDDWLKTLKDEISSNVLVLFVLSENYYKSTVSICEMGAAWALSKKHIPIVIPPMDYKDISGVIPLTQGFKIDEKHKWTMLKTQLEKHFNLTPKIPEIWESRRDAILGRIAELLTLEQK